MTLWVQLLVFPSLKKHTHRVLSAIIDLLGLQHRWKWNVMALDASVPKLLCCGKAFDYFFSFPYGSHLFSSRCTDSSDVSAMCALCFVHRAPKNICFLTGYADSKLANGKRLCVHFLGLSIFFMFTWKMYCLLQAVRQQP